MSATLETYAEQTLQNDYLTATEISAGVGILPELELVAFFGVLKSRYDISLWWITIDNNQPSNLSDSVTQTISYLGVRANYSWSGIANFQPALGLSVSSWSMNSGYDHLGQPELQNEFHDFGTPSMIVCAAEPGLKIRTAKLIELWLRVPLTYSIIDGAPQTFQTVDELQYEERLSLESYDPFGYGIMAGFNVLISLGK